MHVVLVQVDVVAEHVQDFIEATLANARESVKEPGNRRFDILQLSEDPSKFVLYESYATAEDSAAHKLTPHYLTWKETVAGWMASPRVGVRYDGLFPE